MHKKCVKCLYTTQLIKNVEINRSNVHEKMTMQIKCLFITFFHVYQVLIDNSSESITILHHRNDKTKFLICEINKFVSNY